MNAFLLLAGGLAGGPDASASIDALPPPELALRAEAEYKAGLAVRSDAVAARRRFAEAARLYGALRERSYSGSDLYRNLGQAQFLAGDLGSAIATYRSGLMRHPGDGALRRGLRYLRERVAYPLNGKLKDLAQPRESWSLFHVVPSGLIKWAAPFLFLAACLAFARGCMVPRAGWWIVGSVLCIVSAITFVIAMQELLHGVDSERPFAVTIAADAQFRTGNSSEYPQRLESALPAGVELRRLIERGGWVQVELAGGPVGWVPRKSIAIIE